MNRSYQAIYIKIKILDTDKLKLVSKSNSEVHVFNMTK